MSYNAAARLVLAITWFAITIPFGDDPHWVRRPVCWITTQHSWGPGPPDQAKCLTCGYVTDSPYGDSGRST